MKSLLMILCAATLLLVAACGPPNVRVYRKGDLPPDIAAEPVGLKVLIGEGQRAEALAAVDLLRKELAEMGIRTVAYTDPHRFLVTVEQLQADPKTTSYSVPVAQPVYGARPNGTFGILYYTYSQQQHTKTTRETGILLRVHRYNDAGEPVEVYARAALYEGPCRSLQSLLEPLYRVMFRRFPKASHRDTISLGSNC